MLSLEKPEPLTSFRTILEGWGQDTHPEAIDELEVSAQFIIDRCLNSKRDKKLRPSHMARELKQFATGLERAVKALNAVGDYGMIIILAASGADREADKTDPARHIEYLTRMARWARRAAENAKTISNSSLDHLGGRESDKGLDSAMTLLIERFQECLSIRVTHRINSETGLGDGLFAIFAKGALLAYASPERQFEASTVDASIHRVLASRNSEPFTPPAQPE